ncbi:TetR/AcrR family transcriptional regulator [Clostridium thermobutyricum]|uniref:TetR/AcrR family transcriptional regulator n=1 Tax=Clostridium thermobutyricum TaxID=29372 RepID=UPI002943CF4E|nr:TetR/AcrR family transcriptional regulator [Clostridium thermobutyricum]
MKKVSIDRRIIRTKKMIRSALAELINENGFNNISITDLTKRADINRGTFYLHYIDKYDLLDKIENEIIQEIEDKTKHIDSINIMNIDTLNEPLPFIVKLFEYFKENSVIIKSLLGPKGDPTFESKIKKFIKTNLFDKQKSKNFSINNAIVSEEYFIQYILAADLGVIKHWLEKNMKESPDEIALILIRMSLLGPLKAIGINKHL